MPPLDLHLISRVAAYLERAYSLKLGLLVEQACTRIRGYFGAGLVDISPSMIGHPYPAPKGWARQWRGYVGRDAEPLVKPHKVLLDK
jgi:hypothetical protein